MKKLLGMVILSLFLAVSGIAQRSDPPAFRDFSVKVEAARVKKINFRKNPGAVGFRTRLSAAIRDGVNFAGHYVIAGWGCGTGCVSAAIIDARNGNVVWPEQLTDIGVWYGNDEYAEKPVNYKKNSRLLIVTGSPGAKVGKPDNRSGEYYYEWKNDRFRLVKFIEKKTQQ